MIVVGKVEAVKEVVQPFNKSGTVNPVESGSFHGNNANFRTDVPIALVFAPNVEGEPKILVSANKETNLHVDIDGNFHVRTGMKDLNKVGILDSPAKDVLILGIGVQEKNIFDTKSEGSIYRVLKARI